MRTRREGLKREAPKRDERTFHENLREQVRPLVAARRRVLGAEEGPSQGAAAEHIRSMRVAAAESALRMPAFLKQLSSVVNRWWRCVQFQGENKAFKKTKNKKRLQKNKKTKKEASKKANSKKRSLKKS